MIHVNTNNLISVFSVMLKLKYDQEYLINMMSVYVYI